MPGYIHGDLREIRRYVPVFVLVGEHAKAFKTKSLTGPVRIHASIVERRASMVKFPEDGLGTQ